MRPGPQGERDQLVGRSGLEQALRQVTLLRLGVQLRGDVELAHRHDPVQPEQPDPLHAQAPALQVAAAVDQEQPERVDVALGGLVATGHVVGQVQAPLGCQGCPYDRQDRLLPFDGHRHPASGFGGGAGGGLHLGQRAVDDVPLGQPRSLGQGAQGDQQGERLIDREPKRAGHPGGLGQGDRVALELQVDEVPGPVPR